MRSATTRQMKVPTDEAISVIIIRRKKTQEDLTLKMYSQNPQFTI